MSSRSARTSARARRAASVISNASVAHSPSSRVTSRTAPATMTAIRPAWVAPDSTMTWSVSLLVSSRPRSRLGRLMDWAFGSGSRRDLLRSGVGVPARAAETRKRRQCELGDLTHHAAELPVQRAGVVRDAVALADLADLGRDLRVAVGRQVGEQVVLDLVAEVAGHDVEELAAREVGRPEQLPVVPLPAGLVGGLLRRELVRAVREMAAEDDGERPQVACEVRRCVAGERERQ